MTEAEVTTCEQRIKEAAAIKAAADEAAARAAHADDLAGEQRLASQAQAGKVALSRIRGTPGSTAVAADHTVTFKDAFVTVGAPASVVSARGFYEVTLVAFTTENTHPQFGWAGAEFEHCVRQTYDGVGDDEHSWGVDGARRLKFFGDEEPFGEPWAEGDVLGFAADCETGRILFARNGQWSTPFEGIDPARMRGLYPALTASASRLEIAVNFGDRPFAHGPPDDRPWALNV